MANVLNHRKELNAPFPVSRRHVAQERGTYDLLLGKFLLHILKLRLNQADQLLKLLVKESLQILSASNQLTSDQNPSSLLPSPCKLHLAICYSYSAILVGGINARDRH